MDERFDNPVDEDDDASADTEETTEASENTETSEATSASKEQSPPEQSASSTSESDNTDDLNIREDWDSATIYVEPEQSEDIEVTFTRLKKQLKREEDLTLEKNKHFYRGIFEVAFGEHREETKEKIRELANQERDR
ncbi:hypothetical protein [Haloarcula amylovorans]|uniref:hypothetical protein n=1 Tax=Haloarcula amylovorans TaxID=2562280 RepID=UPI001ADD7391|nr:hypothetical protein [Halomicroarcula amylolytica]